MIQTSPGQQLKPVISPRGGPVDGEVTLSMVGLPPLQPVRIGFGSFGQYELVGRAEADELGNIHVNLRVPNWAQRDGVHFFFVSLGGQVARALSDPFHVTGPDGVARIAGTINAELGMGCLGLVGPYDTPYALEGEVDGWSPGQRVQVTGTVADRAPCGGEGLPISVREIRQA
jgi:hypothetical protein